MTLKTERLLIDPIRETDKADYFRSVTVGAGVLDSPCKIF